MLTHPWDLNPAAATRLQHELAPQVVISPQHEFSIQIVAGVDVGYFETKGIARAAIALYGYPDLVPIGQAVAEIPVSFPYIPGLLSFREIPAILMAFEKLKIKPDLWIIDGHGVAHQRRFGLASHFGLILDIAAIGCAKSRLVGSYESLGKSRGSVADLMDDGEVIGAVVRTRDLVKPVFISVGHRVDLNSAVRISLNCCQGYRLPEPIRRAHHLASENYRKISVAGKDCFLN